MKFRFCGERDCPDWLLAEIVLLTKITSVKMKLLVSNVIKDLLGSPLDYAKVNKLTADAKLDANDQKICIAIISFFITNAAKNGIASLRCVGSKFFLKNDLYVCILFCLLNGYPDIELSNLP
eukprot:m.125655 g.125655  ORF g.125655 m.125655 type:complete len:122 (+) comp17335_c0_seq2:150-515(+)